MPCMQEVRLGSPYSALAADDVARRSTTTAQHRSRGGLVLSKYTHEATDPGSILGIAIFPGSAIADSERSESRRGYSSTIKIPTVIFS